MRYEIKSFGAWAFVKVSFFLNLVIGFILGMMYAGFLGLFLAVSSSMPFEGLGAMPIDPEAIGPAFFIFMPIFGAVAGAIFHTILGLIIIGTYNLIAKLIGGLEMTLESVEQANPVNAAPAPMAQAYQSPPPPPPIQENIVRPAPPPPPTDQPPTDSDPETP